MTSDLLNHFVLVFFTFTQTSQCLLYLREVGSLMFSNGVHAVLQGREADRQNHLLTTDKKANIADGFSEDQYLSIPSDYLISSIGCELAGLNTTQLPASHVFTRVMAHGMHGKFWQDKHSSP